MNKIILVTGGAGYIGSHTCKALALAGWLPVTLDNLICGHEWAVKWGPFVKADILDRAALDRVFEQYQPKAVFHFAAFAYVGESVTDPGKYYRNNVAGTVSLLEAMRDHGCRYLVFSSTCATYGVPETIPIPEDHPRKPINAYGWSKRMIEQILQDFDYAYDTRSVSLRYFNAAGADPDGEIGEVHTPETHLIPLVIEATSGRRPYVEIYGTDYPTPDQTAIRDYIHVTDLAEAHVLALNYLFKDGETNFFNLGTGQGHSVRDVITAVEMVSGNAVPVRESDRRAGDSPILVATHEKASKILDWSPRISKLDEIVKTAWEWHLKSEK
jgi:UDP-arabinose 4-epimerase